MGVQPIDELLLRKLETGVVRPDPTQCFTLSRVHRLALHELLDLLAIQEIIDRSEKPPAGSDLLGAHVTAWQAGKWEEAMTVAAIGEIGAVYSGEWIKWRANRAFSMSMLGMGRTAELMLLDLSDSHDLTAENRFQVLRTLADVHVNAGHYTIAAETARLAIQQAPADLEPEWRWALIQTQVRLALVKAEHADRVNEQEVNGALFCLQDARRLTPEGDLWKMLTIDLMEEVAKTLLGQVSGERFARIAKMARNAQHAYLEMAAWKNLGVAHRREYENELAREALDTARDLAADTGDAAELFDINYELHVVAEASGDEEESQRCLQECHLHFPLVQVRTPNVRAYERLMRAV